jgi:hypothetical protein
MKMGERICEDVCGEHRAGVGRLTVTPVAHADMLVGYYRLDTNRDPGHHWLWSIRPCVTNEPACLHVQAVPQPNGQAAAYDGDARLVNGRYLMADVPDGVRCVPILSLT